MGQRADEKRFRKWEKLPQLLDIEDVAHMLSVRAADVRKLIESGQLPPPFDVAGHPRWSVDDVQGLIKCKRDFRYYYSGFDPAKHLLTLPPAAPPDVPEELAAVANKLLAYDSVPPCVYFLINFGSIVYVGKSCNLSVRLHQHRRGTKKEPPKEFNRVLYLPVEPALLDQAEAYYIKLLEPILNRAGVERP